MKILKRVIGAIPEAVRREQNFDTMKHSKLKGSTIASLAAVSLVLAPGPSPASALNEVLCSANIETVRNSPDSFNGDQQVFCLNLESQQGTPVQSVHSVPDCACKDGGCSCNIACKP